MSGAAAYTATRPLLVAHRAGNEPAMLREAQSAGVDLVELDVWRFRGRLEVRHLKTMGPVPLLWDRWALGRGWTPRLTLAALLEDIDTGGPELLLDLKGVDPRLPGDVVATMARFARGRRYSVCSQQWQQLEPFRELEGVRVFHSIGGRAVLDRVLANPPEPPLEAISIHRKLLSPRVVGALLRLVPLVTTWPVNTPAMLARLRGWGVNGFTSDNLALLAGLARERDQPA